MDFGRENGYRRKKLIHRPGTIRRRSSLLPSPGLRRSTIRRSRFLVSLDSPVGLHEGGQVAAPVFKRVAEQVLAYLDVSRDVPLNPKLIETAYMKRAAEDPSALEESSSVDFSGQPDPPPAASQSAKADSAGASRFHRSRF